MKHSVITKTVLAVMLAFGQCGFVHAEETEETTPEITEKETSLLEENLSSEEEITQEEDETEEGDEVLTEEEELPAEEEIPEEEVTEDVPEEEPAEEVTEEVSEEEETDLPEETEITESEEAEETGEPVLEETEENEPEEETPVEEGEEGTWSTGELYEDGEVIGKDHDASYWNIYIGTKSYTYHQTEARRMLKMVNNFRTSGKAWIWNPDGTKKTGIKVDALQYDTALEDIAMQRAAEISIYFAHTRPDASSCFTAYYEYNGRSYAANGENILYGTSPYGANAESSFDMWKEENEGYSGQGHRRNMLGESFTAIGIGYAVVNGINFWVMELGRKTVVPDKSPLDGSMKRQMPVCTDLISSVSDFKAKPSSLKLAVGEEADLPDVSAKVTVSAHSGSFTMSTAYPYYGTVEIPEEYKNIITLTEDKKVKGVALGEAAVSLFFGTGKAQKKVSVPVSVVIHPESITLDETSIIVDRDTSFRLHASVLPEDASDKSVAWTSSDKSVAVVSSDGTVTGKGAGTAVITATTNDMGLTASCTVKVEVHVTDVQLGYESLTLREEMTETLQYKILPSDAEDQTVTWTSSDPSVVSVDDNGVITALKEGNAVITVTTHDRGKTDSVEVTVKALSRVQAPYLAYYDETGKQVTVSDLETAEVKKGTLVKLVSDTEEAEIVYLVNGNGEQTYSSPFPAKEDMEILAFAKHSGMRQSEEAVITVKIKDESVLADPGDLCEEDIQEVNEKYGGIVPDGIWAAGIPETVTYTGSKVTFPDMRVYDHKTLLNSSSYSVVYKNNTNASKETADTRIGWTPPAKTKAAYVQITGKGNYTGKTYIPFVIERKSLNDETVSVSDMWIKTNGKAQKPVPAVTDGKKALKANKDFSVVYIDSNGIEQTSVTEGGTYTIRLEGLNNYTDTKTVTLTVEDAPEVVLMSKLSVSVSAWKAENGLPVTAETPLVISVKNGKKAMSPDTYRVVEVRNGEACGTASLVLEGTGVPDETSGKVISGRKTISFKITGTSLKNAKAVIPAETYTGEAVEPSEFTVTLNDVELTEGTDYEISGYSANTNASAKASVKIKGKGLYTGTKSFTFRINKVDIHSVTVNASESAQYEPAGAAPAISLVYLGKILKAGKDYTVKYTGNKKAGSTASAVITGKGSFTGTLDPITFTVEKKPLSSVKMTASDIPYSSAKKGTYYQRAVSLKDGTKTLTVKDYDKKSVSWTYVYDTRVKQYAKNNNGKTVLRMAGDPVGANDVPAEGTYLRVSVSALETGNYTGTISQTYKVIAPAYSLAKATVRFNVKDSEGNVSVKKTLTKQYTGSPVTVSEDELYITIRKNRSEYVLQPEEYEIISYASNIKKGTAKMTIRGTGDFGGTKTVSFKIAAQKMTLRDILFSVFGG